MSMAEENIELRIFKELPLAEKIILYERGELASYRKQIALFQEMIDSGVCWDKDMHSHYACFAANYIRIGECAESRTISMPEEARKPLYLFEYQWVGYDLWGRPPTHEDWGRPFRWKEIRKERIKQFKINLGRFEGGEEIKLGDHYGGCCK